ncbi:Rad4-domain-containing protein [Echria macrotheca]|uniref:Rad4-domain-containing protein n=1 Tax=Echria macrotheca TaxID=438768 RepID=A0AAJ0FA39_9PEZI|nr:Rad4-domain-containing protein [Echria macrotheca]
MAGRKRSAPATKSPRAARSRAGPSGTAQNPAVPTVYRDLLREARRAAPVESPERPTKRLKRPGERTRKPTLKENPDDGNDDEDDIEFEDVVIPAATVQTVFREDSDEEDEDDIQFEDVDTLVSSSAVPAGQQLAVLNLNLTEQKNAMTSSRAVERRKAIGKAEKERRVHVHKIHLLCLLSHVERRNRWCNDAAVQETLRPHLTDKMMRLLNPRSTLIQYGRTESLKTGLQETSSMFKSKFRITERGLRRALWPENEEQLKDYQIPEDSETTHEKSDFLDAAKSLQGSRDVGAQLFCALLRSAGVEARLVCSLQALSCVPGGPTMPKQKGDSSSKPTKGELYAAAVAKYESTYEDSAPLSARRRLGHPLATAYNVPSIDPPPSRPTSTGPKPIRGESPYPVYWVEVLDVAQQKWHPVDPLVTGTQWRPRALEPPASDTLNCLSYAIAFEADGSARDVTRRYAKAYNSKTKRLRIDGPNIPANRSPGVNRDGTPSKWNAGERWWRRAMRRYRRPFPTDLDQIEERELAAEEAKEPMPRNVADFKDHPVYALERHLRRHEVLVPDAQPSGTVGAGSKGPLEKIYRRRDVRIARSKERWYRLGRIVLDGEVAVKILPKQVRRKSRFGEEDDDNSENDDPDRVGLFGDDAAGTPIYMLEQTEVYKPPPVVGGKVPKNRFGNIDVYVPSMVPEGGVHIAHERAAFAAFILGVDYAPALTGFEFKGRKGTAVLSGVVVPTDAEEGVWAVIEGLSDLEAEMEEERKRRGLLRMWSRFMKVLRIRERIYAGVDEEAEEEAEAREKEKGVAEDDEMGAGDVSGGFMRDDEGGGFFID